MSGIEMWQEAGMGTLDILGALWWDVVCGLMAAVWCGLVLFWWVSTAVEEMPGWWRWKDWRAIGRWLVWGTLIIPLCRLVWFVIQIWFLR